MKVKLITAPASYPLNIAEMMDALSIFDNTQEIIVERCLKAAVNIAENFTQRKFVSQVWEYYLNKFPCERELVLPFPPLVSVESIKYTTAAGVLTTFSSANYAVDVLSEPAKIVLKRTAAWPGDTLYEVNPVVVKFTCGWADADSVPDEIKHALILIAGDLYENREDVVQTTGTITSQMELKANSSYRLFPFKIFQDFE